MQVGTRLGLSFGIMLLFMVALIYVGLDAMESVHHALEEIVMVENASSRLANNMIDHGREMSITIRNMLLKKYRGDSEDAVLKLVEKYHGLRKAFHDDIEELKKVISSSDTATLKLLEDVEKVKAAVWAEHDKVLTMIRADQTNEASDHILGENFSGIEALVNVTEELAKSAYQHTNQRHDESDKDYAETHRTMIILGVVALLSALTIAIFLTLGITQPLNLCIKAARSIAAKDLSVDLATHQDRNDELGVMTQSFSRMVDALRDQIQEISNGVNVLASSSNEILVSTSQVAAGAVESATAINETMTTVEEVRQAARLSSEKARNVADSAQRVVQVSQTGKSAVEQTTVTMQNIREQMTAIAQTILRLSEQSQAIGGIIATVTDLADQSNLLAVNAGIEAARAGEQGKGFSVVAQEIKSLAEQSKQATAQVRAILTDVQKATNVAVMATEQGTKAVEAGVKQSVQTGEAVKALTDSSLEASQIATQIVASSQQQVVGMDQIGVAMENINQAGAQNASAMKQAESASKNLNELGQKLRKIVEQFKIKGA